MKVLKKQLQQLLKELSSCSMSKERVLQIKDLTLQIAHKIDEQTGIAYAESFVVETYSKETKYPKRRVKKVVRILLEYTTGLK